MICLGVSRGPVLCPVCDEGYLVTLKDKNWINGVAVDSYFDLCINGCGSEQAGHICVDENARIAREAGFGKFHWVEDR